MWDESKITTLESPEDIQALLVNDVIKAELTDGYKGILVCAGTAPSKHENHLQMMVTNVTNIVYLLCVGHISINNGIARQKADCRKYARAENPKLFEIIDERLFN